MTTIYGIRNCDTTKRALAWLERHGVRYEFHDYKLAGIDRAQLQSWSAQCGWQPLLNTRGTTWRKLTRAQQTDLDEAKALRLMSIQPGLINRPVLAHGGILLVGFDAARYTSLFAKCVVVAGSKPARTAPT